MEATWKPPGSRVAATGKVLRRHLEAAGKPLATNPNSSVHYSKLGCAAALKARIRKDDNSSCNEAKTSRKLLTSVKEPN